MATAGQLAVEAFRLWRQATALSGLVGRDGEIPEHLAGDVGRLAAEVERRVEAAAPVLYVTPAERWARG